MKLPSPHGAETGFREALLRATAATVPYEARVIGATDRVRFVLGIFCEIFTFTIYTIIK